MPGIEISASAKTTLNQLFIDTTSTQKLSGSIDLTKFSALLEANIKNCHIESFDGGTNLQLLFLINNKLGEFPSMFKMPNLKIIQIENDSRISGTIPSLDFNTKLERLTVANLNLNGTIPNLKNCVELKKFQVNNNNFSGNLPTLSACTKLELVDISHNNINGTLQLDTHNSLSTFNANDNVITGTMPSLDSFSALREFNVNNNSFSGPLPSLSSNTFLKFFRSFGNNSVTGPFPAFPTLNTQLEVFDARNNNLSGPLPPLSSTPNLKFYVAKRNPGNLTGPLPEFSAASGLTNFEFTGHNFVGTVPNLSNNTALKFFNVDTNALSGEFPSVENCSQLIHLRFNNNKNKLSSPGFTGDIPTISACTSLRVYDVATNNLTGYAGGSIPASLENIQALNNNLSSAAVNAILAAIVANNSTSPSPRGVTRRCNLGGSNAVATGQGLIDKATLIDRGWLTTTS